MKTLLISSLLAVPLLINCAHKTKPHHMNPTATTTTTASQRITDAQIANEVLTANTEEMSMAKLARDRASDKRVKHFAAMMYTDHAKNNDQAMAVAKKEGVLPMETDMSRTLKNNSESDYENLTVKKGKAFDQAYMEAQVNMHEKVLDKLTNDYIPHSQNPELRALLEKTRTKVEMHLNEAKEIQRSL